VTAGRAGGLWLALAGCAGGGEEGSAPTADGPVVGVQTLSHAGLTLEVWYPADPVHAGEPTEEVAFEEALSEEVLAALGSPELPRVDSGAVRGAAVHPDGPFPAVVFSHGFGGTREQSVSLTTHLAAQGFVVVATDHRGRSLPDFVPCVFSPALDGCELAIDDPAPPELSSLADWLDAPTDGFDGMVQAGAYGLFGHSAGGGSTVTAGNDDPRFVALAPMAGGDAVTRSDVAVQRWAGSCDGLVGADALLEAHDASAAGRHAELVGAGHLAFSDLCALDLGGIVEELAGRDDVNQVILDLAADLAVDGCPEAAPLVDSPDCADGFLDLDTSEGLLEEGLASFFRAELLGDGDGAYPDDPAVRVID